MLSVCLPCSQTCDKAHGLSGAKLTHTHAHDAQLGHYYSFTGQSFHSYDSAILWFCLVWVNYHFLILPWICQFRITVSHKAAWLCSNRSALIGRDWFTHSSSSYLYASCHSVHHPIISTVFPISLVFPAFLLVPVSIFPNSLIMEDPGNITQSS